MPEGDTVWLACRHLNRALAGQEINASDFRVPQLANADLSGATVLEVVSRGKHQLFRFDEGTTLHTHFRMDGTWHLYRRSRRGQSEPASRRADRSAEPIQPVDRRERRPGAPRRGGADHQIRVILTTSDWEAVGYRLPVVELVPTAEEHAVVGHLGPDLLGPDWDAAEALRRLRAGPDRSIGEALLDQRNLAGIGTLYRAETLFLSGVHPRRPVAEVPDLPGVVERARRLLHANRERPEQVTTGDRRRGHEHWVFNRGKRPCRRCGTPVREEAFGPPGQERRSFWCPICQPG